MSMELLSRTSENTIRITAEFFEDGYVLKSGRSGFHRYELDLYVRSDVTLDQLLGALFCGLRDILQDRYKLDLRENLAGIVYQDLQNPFAFRAADSLRGSRALRPEQPEGIRLRTEAMRYRHQRRALADLNERYRMVPDASADLTPEQRERLGWIVCWQVFHECYQSYAAGYPDEQGKADASQVRSQAYLMHPVIARSAVDLQDDEYGSYYGAARYPQLQLMRHRDGSATLEDLGFVSSTRLIFDPVLWHHSAALYDTRALDPSISEQLPYYVFDTREKWKPDTTSVSIQPLQSPPMKPDLRNTPLLLLVPLIMLLSSLLCISLGGGIETASFFLVFIIMLTATLLTGLVCWGLYWFSYQWTVKHWVRPYEQEIRNTLMELTSRQQDACAMMHQNHPPVYDPEGHTDLIHQILKFEGDLYGTEPGDWDFLCARLGVSVEGSNLVPSVFRVDGINGPGPFSEIRYRNLHKRDPNTFELTWKPRKDGRHPRSADSGMLTELPANIARAYGTLIDAPVLMDLKNAGAVGLVYQDQKRSFAPLLHNLILDLCYHHAPEQLQLVALFPPETDWKARNDLVRPFRYLPHFDTLLKDRSAFAFSQTEASAIFDHLYHKLQYSMGMGHIVVFVMEEYGLRQHPLSSYLPGNRGQSLLDRGITFVFCKHSQRELPPWCASTLVVDPRDNWFLLHSSRNERDRRGYSNRADWGACRLKPDPLIDARTVTDHKPIEDLLHRSFRTVSAIRHRKDDHNQLPLWLDLFSMLTYPDQPEPCLSHVKEERQAYLEQMRDMVRDAIDDNWSLPASNTLDTPIGCGEGGLVTLDLHEERDGPNLLIAGSRQTGKTSAALTLFHAMALLYSPETVALVPVDLADHGLARELQYLPHTLQEWTLRGGTREDVLQYLQRLLSWLNQESLRRTQLLGNASPDADRFVQDLFIILDDYGLLERTVREQLDLSEALEEMMRFGRDLGIHFVLISSGSEASVPNFLLEHLRARICLQVSDERIAQRVCGSMASARMSLAGTGRACRIGGEESPPELFQFAFGGVDVAGLAYAPFQVVLAPTGGRNRCFFDSRVHVPDDEQELSAWLRAVHEPLQVTYRKKRSGPKNTSEWEPDPETAPIDEDEKATGFGDTRWGAARSDENRTDPRDSGFGDKRWSGTHTNPHSSADGDDRWDDSRSRHHTADEGDRRWEARDQTAKRYTQQHDTDCSSNGTADADNHTADLETEQSTEPVEEKTGWDVRWQERFFRRWNGYPYNHVAPDYVEAGPEEESRLVRPDEALMSAVPFGITQQQFAAAVMADVTATRTLSADATVPNTIR